MLIREPLLYPVLIDDLRPTQITVGYREVARKRQDWKERVDRDGPEYLGRHMIPVVIGPKQRLWMIDNHHLALALHQEGIDKVLVRTIADLSNLETSIFKNFMDNRNWLHPFDAKGKRQLLDQLPKHVKQLGDDPYRSLAGELRRAGGYAKEDTPFSEFLWADYFRHRINPNLLERKFEAAVAKALALARSESARYLPGWAGPHH